MNKRGLIKNIVLLIAVLISLLFITNKIVIDIYGLSICILLPTTIFLLSKKRNINNKIYNIVTLTLLILSLLITIILLIQIFKCAFDTTCIINFESVFLIPYISLLIYLPLDNINDIKNNTNKLNDILIIITSFVVIIIHILYLRTSYYSYELVNDNFIEMYISKTCVYIFIMYISLIIHKYICKKY